MGHDIGKVAIIGRVDYKLFLKQIHSRPEEPKNASRIMVRKIDDQAGWLDDAESIDINSELV